MRVATVAVFDLDNTLIRGSSLYHFGRALMWRRVVAPHHVLRYAVAEASYACHRGEPKDGPSTIAQRTLSLVRGVRQEALVSLADWFVRERLDRHLDQRILRHVRDFQGTGRTILATASPQELADAVAERLGMTLAVGTVAEVVGGQYTGRLASPICHGIGKAQRVCDVLDAWGIPRSQSWAFSDSVNDSPLLAAVGNPVAANPDGQLRRIAQRNGWPIVARDSHLPGDWREFALPVIPF